MRAEPTALIADDEPLLRRSLQRQLEVAWPELRVVAFARNGREAVDLFEQHRPDVCFLDVQMPGMSGVEAARHIGGRAKLVFVTAFQQYAVQAFEQGVLDYLVKPVEASRLATTVDRLKARWRLAQSPGGDAELLDALAARLGDRGWSVGLRWLRASVGNTVRLLAVDEIEYLRAEDKYTTVAWRDPSGATGDAVIRMSLKELLTQLDARHFVQIHRAVVVNLRAISHIERADNDTGLIHLRHRPERLPVSRSYLHLFRQM